MQKIILIFAILLLPIVATADYPLETIELKGRTAEEILPMVRPFIEPGGAVSGMNNMLILRTSPANLREIRKLLSRIDTPPRRLMISVRRSSQIESQLTDKRAGVNVKLGKETRVMVGSPTRDGSVRIQGISGTTERGATHTSQVQAIEGQPAFIAVGQSVPVHTQQRLVDGDIRLYQGNTIYRDATSGFYARARVNGQRVTIEISPFKTELGRSPGSFDISRATTRINGRLGEWFSMGGIAHSAQKDRKGMGISASTERRHTEQFEIRVDELR